MSSEGKKFSLIETPKISKLSPLYLGNASNDPKFFTPLHIASEYWSGCKVIKTVDEPISYNLGSNR